MEPKAGLALLERTARPLPGLRQGPPVRRFLKVADACDSCGEEFHHHRADDFPAYLVIVLVGHSSCR